MKKINLIVLCLLITIVKFSTGQTTFPFWSEGTIKNFHTRGNFRDTGSNVSIYFEEFYSYDDGKGRLDLRINETIVSMVYYNATNQMIYVSGFGSYYSWNCTVIDKIGQQNLGNVLSKYPAVSKFSWFFKNLWRDKTQQNEFIMIGPTALLRKVKKLQSSFNLQTSNQPQIVRGINTRMYSLKATGQYFGAGTTMKFYFIDSAWKGAGNIQRTIPLRIQIDYNNGNSHIDIEYFVFNRYYTAYNEFLPRFGVGCVGRKTDFNSVSLPEIDGAFSVK